MKRPENAPEREAFEKALRLLSLRDHSCREMRSKLSERGYPEPVVDRTIDRLVERKYLDDSQFAVRRARHLAYNKLYGNLRIRADLLERGVSRDLADSAISEARLELDEAEGLKRLMEKKHGEQMAQDLDRKNRRRLAQSLLRKGYPAALVLEHLRKSTEDFTEDL